MVISGLVAVYVLSILSAVHSQSTTVGGNTCPRKLSGSAASDRCSKACSSDANCSGDKRCLCDDVCGMSCVNPAANCPRLELLENGRIEPDENTRVFGTVVTFSCEDGYRVSQNGDSEIHCQGNREWSGTPPTCVIDASCGQPVDFDNARHDGRQNAYDVGDRIVYSCNSGYFRRGLSVSRCLANGQWTPLDLECMPKSCGNPGDIPNARRIGSVFTFPNRVYYECNTGYTLFGREYRSCQTNQQWSNSPPECRPVTCSRQFAPEDGSSFGSRFTYNEEVRFHCNEGYKLVGSEYRTCQADGTWSGAEPSCRAINCGPPEPIWNGYIDRDSFGFRTVIIFECNSGAVLVGSRSTYCQEDETWSSPTPKCWKMCVVGAPPANGFYRGNLRQGTSVVHETTLDIRCRSGYDLSQEESTSCYNGTWQNFPTCDARPCLLLREPINGRTNQDKTRITVPHNTHVTYTCDRGYFLNGEQTRLCWYGNWTPRGSTTCRARQCPFDTYIEHGSVTFLDANGNRFSNPRANDLIQWTQRKFSCNQGYTLFGDDRNICDEGQWTQNQTVCNPDPCSSVPDANGIYRHVRYLRQANADDQYPHESYAEVSCIPGRIFAGNNRFLQCNLGRWLPEGELCIEEPCQLPPLPDNAEFTSSYERSIPSRESIGFRCRRGYNMIGGASVVCRSGEWRGRLPECTPAPCAIIDSSERLRVNYDDDDDQDGLAYLHGTTATFSCSSSSYEISGLEQVECRFGDWSGEIPECVPASCQITPDISQDHGAVNTDSSKVSHGEYVTYTCHEGYEIDGRRLSNSVNIRCTFGRWIGSFPNCIPASCTLLPADGLTHINPQGNYLESGEGISFTCADGLVPDPADEQVTCFEGSFLPNIPGCKRAPCQLPQLTLPLIIKSHRYADSRLVDGETEIEIGCTDGYMPVNGDTNQICQDGIWRVPVSNPTTDARNPVCQQDECSIPEMPINGRVSVTLQGNNQQVASFTCDDGFDLNFGPQDRICRNGQWEGGALPICVEVTEQNPSDEKACVKPPDLDHGTIKINGDIYIGDPDDEFPEGTNLQFYCDVNFRLSGSSDQSTCQDGSWTSSFPTCVDERSCECPETNDNVIIYYDNKQLDSCSSRLFPPGTVITQRCSDIGKYILSETRGVSSITRTCHNTQWTANVATCQRSVGEITLEGDSPREVTEDGRLFVYPLEDTLFYLDCRSLSPRVSHRSLTWYRGSKRKSSYSIGNGYQRLRFRSPQNKHSGTYTCWYRSTAQHYVTLEMQAVQCPDVPDLANGTIVPNRHRLSPGPFILGDTVSFSCGYGYQLHGVSTVTCTYRGEWSDRIPTCQPSTCPDIDAPEDGFKTHSSSTVGSKIEFSCNQGYILEGVNEIECGPNFRWSDGVPTCRNENECGNIMCEEWEICTDRSGVKECACRPASHCVEGDDEHVCGTDGRTYRSLCRLNAIRCLGRDVQKASDGVCSGGTGQPGGDETEESSEETEESSVDETFVGGEECNRSCPPDTIEIACERARLGNNFVLFGNLSQVLETEANIFYTFAVKRSIPIDDRPIQFVEVVRGPVRRQNGCQCPQIENRGSVYVIFGTIATDGTSQLQVESHNYAAVLNNEEITRLTTVCPALFE